MVNNMVKVVNIVHAQSTSHIDASATITEMESETNSRPRQGRVSMLQSQEISSIVQYSFRTSDRL